MQGGCPGLSHVINLTRSFSPAESLILRNSTHTGPIRGLDFSPIQTSLLSSGGINGEVSTDHTHKALSDTINRSTSGISKTPANHTPRLQALVAPNLTKSHLLRGTNKSNTSWLALAARDTLSFGTCEVRERSSHWHMAVELGL